MVSSEAVRKASVKEGSETAMETEAGGNYRGCKRSQRHGKFRAARDVRSKVSSEAAREPRANVSTD
jgi:hypothetical protein